MDIHLVRVSRDVDVVNVMWKPEKWGERPAFFSFHVDSYVVPCMGLDLGSLHSATADVIINSPTSDRHATQPGSVLQFPIQLFICPQIGSK